MFSVRQKRGIAAQIQAILRNTKHPKLPDGEIQFSLHVHGEENWSWAEIRNNGSVTAPSVNPHNEAQDPDQRPISDDPGFPQTHPPDDPRVDPLVCFLDASERMARLLGKIADLDVSCPLLKLLAMMSDSAIRMETGRHRNRGPELTAALAAALAPGHAITRVLDGKKVRAT